MNQIQKDILLRTAKRHVRSTLQEAATQVPKVEKQIREIKHEISHAQSFNDKAITQRLLEINYQRLAGLRGAEDAPYFSRCDIIESEKQKPKTLYFGKFSLPELGIYSWAAPAAVIRFEKPGAFSFKTAIKEIQGTLIRNDHYLIAHGHINFMATETETQERTLIYQENFSNRKSIFILPEIVERMEKAQDEIIRADSRGPLLIAGPAGSGKTTLALHRIAYLLQAPETSAQFNASDMLVLVQDDSTKKYFEELLPSLGITDVRITTFSIWAKEQLGLEQFGYVIRYGASEPERDSYEFGKSRALQNSRKVQLIGRTPHTQLERLYSPHFSGTLQHLFAQQKREKILDRFDLVLLLQNHLLINGRFKKIQRTMVDATRSRFVERPLHYSLILIDEVQNYLPQQIEILRSCISSQTEAMTYVGDFAQQTALFTLRNWHGTGEDLSEERIVRLDKVYRSTRQILEYIRSIGFTIEIPLGVRDGKAAEEHVEKNSLFYEQIGQILQENPNVLIGILGISPESIKPYVSLTTNYIRPMTVTEAQGVEFDIVIFINCDIATLLTGPASIQNEKKRIVRDQIYVGLTRAMNQLYVFGDTPLRGVIRALA